MNNFVSDFPTNITELSSFDLKTAIETKEIIKEINMLSLVY